MGTGKQNLSFDDHEIRNKSIRMRGGATISGRGIAYHEDFLRIGAINSNAPQLLVTTEAGSGTLIVPSATNPSYAIGITGATTNNAQELAGKVVGFDPATFGGDFEMWLEARVKFVGATAAVDGDFAIGFSDAVTHASSLPFVVGASSLYTTDAPVEFAGFHYSSIPTSGTLFSATAGSVGNFVGIKTTKNSSGALAVSSGKTKDSNFHIYRVELNAAGDARMYMDDDLVGNVALAVTAATKLTPYINATCKASHALTWTVDYIAGGYLRNL